MPFAESIPFRYSPLFELYRMKQMLTAAVGNQLGPPSYAERIEQVGAAGAAIPQVLRLFRYKLNVCQSLCRRTARL
jgi:hypothetical protein